MSPYEADQDAEAAQLERIARGLVVAVVLAVVVAYLAGCAPVEAAAPIGIEGAAYRAELAECREKSSTCLGYVACRRRVETAHGRAYAGRCEP